MSMPLSKLEKFFYIDKLVIHSLDLALYQVSVSMERNTLLPTIKANF